MQQYKEILAKYLPKDAIEEIFNSIVRYKIHLRIAKNRHTKLGDFRPGTRGQAHWISINHNLNQYSFLITLVHEIAHLVVFEKYKQRVRPHGKEWKFYFRELMQPYFLKNIFPPDIKIALKKYLENPSASSGSNLTLARALQKYDNQKEEGVYIEELPDQSQFIYRNGKKFKRLEKRRKRIKCISMDNNKLYLFDPLTKVYPINK